MTHDELIKEINEWEDADGQEYGVIPGWPYKAIRAVVELHKPELMITSSYCVACTINLETVIYPCPTIQAIEKAVK